MNKRIGNTNFVATKAGTYAIQMDGWTATMDTLMGRTDDWDTQPATVAGVSVVPWGNDNNLPANIRDLLEKNNLGPGILERKDGLLYGNGPMLYRYAHDGNQVVREWTQDKEVQEWLDSWDYRRFVRSALTEYNHVKGVFVRYHCARSVRVGKPWIARLDCLPSSDCRLVWPYTGRRSIDDVKQIMVGDFSAQADPLFRIYPVFDPSRPCRSETAVRYHSARCFGRNFYAVSSFHGSIPWMQDANTLPEIIAYLNKNMIAASYIVHVPEQYWINKEASLQEEHPDWTDRRIRARMEDLKDELAHTIADVMAGTSNAGKFFMTVDFTDGDGKAQSWRIEPIEMNIDKYIDALTKISRIADSSTTSGFGLNPSLANIIIDGKGDSGSQMLYALKLFYGADAQIPEEICLEALNDALHLNFPSKKDLRVGLYRQVINKEDNLTAGKRMVNNI